MVCVAMEMPHQLWCNSGIYFMFLLANFVGLSVVM